MTRARGWHRTTEGWWHHRTADVRVGAVIGRGTVIEERAIVAKLRRPDLRRVLEEGGAAPTIETKVGRNCHVHVGTVIYAGSHLGDEVICTDYVTVGAHSIIGDRTKLQYRAQVFRRVHIAADCRIGGFCCNDAAIGARASMYGSLVHDYRTREGGGAPPAPRVEEDATIACGAIVVGGVVVGRGSYVAAGAVVTKTVPPDTLVLGVNGHEPLSSWRGRLASLPLLPHDTGKPSWIR